MIDMMTPLVSINTPRGNMAKLLGRSLITKSYRYVAAEDIPVPFEQVTVAWFHLLVGRDDRKLLALPGVGVRKIKLIRQLAQDLDEGRAISTEAAA